MGTHAIVRFYCDGKHLVSVYFQYDGYPSGVGLSLVKFIQSKRITRGIALGKEEGTANGVGCLVAQYIAHCKTRVGDVYIVPRGEIEEYNYKVKFVSTGKDFLFDADNYFTVTINGKTLEKFREKCEEDE